MIRKVNFWLNECSGQVNIVLTVKIHKRERISIIEQWKMGNRTPVPIQKLEITKNPAPNYEKGSMRFSFEDIHLGPKGPDDTDFVISHQDIENLAHQVWDEQNKQGKSLKRTTKKTTKMKI
ncbi:hypothetical protein AAEP93_000563 [Penicillium crustosum]